MTTTSLISTILCAHTHTHTDSHFIIEYCRMMAEVFVYLLLLFAIAKTVYGMLHVYTRDSKRWTFYSNKYNSICIVQFMYRWVSVCLCGCVCVCTAQIECHHQHYCLLDTPHIPVRSRAKGCVLPFAFDSLYGLCRPKYVYGIYCLYGML